MRILHVIANLACRYGGPAKACVEMASAVSQLGHDVFIYTTNQDGNKELLVPLNVPQKQDGVSISYFPIQSPRFLGFSWPLKKALSQIIPTMDIVHIHSLYLFHDLVAAYYCRKYHIPYIIRPHGTLDPYLYKRHRFRKWMMEWLFQNHYLKHADGVHFVTEEEARLARPYIYNRPEYVVSNGLDLIQYRNLPSKGCFRNQYDKFNGKKLILFLGRINFKKGLDILIQAFARVIQKEKNAHLVLAGPDNDNYLAKVYRWISQYHLLPYVTYVGMLEGEQKLAALQDADLFVLPSYSENFGISVIESLACGTPVVISNKVNLCLDIEKFNAGIVTPCDEKLFAEGVCALLINLKQREQMSKNGLLLVHDKYSWQEIGKQLVEMYASVLEANKG